MPVPAIAPPLPQLVVEKIAEQLGGHTDAHAPGHCVRIDSIRSEDAPVLVRAVQDVLPHDVADVHVLADDPALVDGTVAIAAERAIELRNRKERQLLLLVPVGTGSAASSLDNSFERNDLSVLLRAAADGLVADLGDDVQRGVQRVARALGRNRPVEAWARYVAAVAADPDWSTLGRMLPLVGLVPDLGGEELADRLERNAQCVKEISRPQRAVASVADRITAAGLQDGPVRDRIARYLGRPDVDLSNAPEWAERLVDEALTFEQWPLVERCPVPVDHLSVVPFLKEDGTLRVGTRLKQDGPGMLPYAEIGESTPASVTVAWKTDPDRTDAIARWLVEALPPEDLREADAEPVAKTTVKGDKRRATVKIEIDEDDLAGAAMLYLRITGLDADGQPVLLTDRAVATADGEQFALRWEAEVLSTGGRRATALSLAHARLEAALDGQDDLDEDAPSWNSGGFSLRLGARRTVLLALSPVLIALQRRAIAEQGRVTLWEAEGRQGELLGDRDIDGHALALPPALADRRRKLYGALGRRAPRDVVETLRWDDDLRAEVAAYCQTFRRALDAAADDATRLALLTMDTLSLSIDTAGHQPIAAVAVLPLHPMRLAWFAEHDATLRSWTAQMTETGMPKSRRRQNVDPRLAARITPANLPYTVLASEGSPLVYLREATLGTGLYLDPGEAEPGAAVQAVFDMIGLDRRDVPPDLPPSVVAERIGAYRTVHPGQDALRMLAYNPGSGELLAQALAAAAVTPPVGEDDLAAPPPRVEVIAYSRRPSFTDPLAALTDLQRQVATQQVRGTRSYLTPALGLSVRPHRELSTQVTAAQLSVVSDLAQVSASGAEELQDVAASFRNLLTPATTVRVMGEEGVVWRTAPALRTRARDGAADVVDAHRAYQRALAARLGCPDAGMAVTARLGRDEIAALHAVHERSDWVLTLDRNVGIDLFAEAVASEGRERPYILDYAPDFIEGLGPRLTVTTSHRGEVARLLADAMTELDLAAVDDSIRDILGNLQIVSGRLALRLVGKSSLATEAVSLAALVAYLRHHGELDGTIIVPVDAHQEMFGEPDESAGARRCDLILVRATSRSLRMECVEVKSRKAAALPAALVDDIVEQIDSTRSMLLDTFFRADPPRIDAQLQRARLVGVLRHHADRAMATGLLDTRRRADAERMFEKVEEGSLVPEIGRKGYVVSLGSAEAFPREHRGVRIDVLTAEHLAPLGLRTSHREPAPRGDETAPQVQPDSEVPTSVDEGAGPLSPRPRPSPRPRRPSPVYESPAVAPPPARQTSAVPDRDVAIPTERTRRPSTVGPVPPAPITEPIPVHAHLPAATLGASSVDRRAPAQVEVVLGRDAHGEPARWRISTAGSPHMFVLGIPGQGKSVTTRHVLNTFADQGLPALVLDFHGDMAAEPAGGAAVLDASEGLAIRPFELRDGNHRRYAQAAWELSEVIAYVCGMGEIQRNAVYEGARELYVRHGFGTPDGPGERLPSMTALADLMTELEATGRSKNTVARLRPLTDFGLFVEDPGTGPSFADLLRQGLVLDVHGLMEQVQLAAGAFVLRKVYREMFRWGATGRLRLAVVLDEAHRLARDVTLPKIMKEGRKYGVAVVVASQGVDDFHKDVLSNAGTKVSFRCNFPQSKTVAGFLRGREGQNMSVALEKLGVGEAYVSTPERPEALKVFMARN